MSRRQYTQAEKAAYYKAKYAATAKRAPRRAYRRRAAPAAAVGGRGAYYPRRRRTYRPRGVIRGHGDYFSDAYKAYGKSRQRSTLGKIGGVAGDAISKWFGFGAYSVKQNALLQDPMPVVNKTGSGSCSIRHREYIGDIITGPAGTFKLQSFSINPGQEGTFPWLSQIAVNYEQYRVEGMLFEFRTMSADALNSTNTALGQVIMATDYNAANPPFGQKSEMENYEFGSSAKPSESQVHPIECARMQTTITELYTRANALPPGEDVRLYDLGNFQIATNGFQASNVNVGELWVTYQVCFLKSKMFSALGNYNTLSSYIINITTGGVITANNPFGVSISQGGLLDPLFKVNTIPVTLSNGATGYGVITFPPSQIIQTYMIQALWQTGVTATTGTCSNVLSNCSQLSSLSSQSQSGPLIAAQVPVPTTSTFYTVYQFCIQTSGGGLIPTVSIANTQPQTGNMGLWITQIPNNASGAID